MTPLNRPHWLPLETWNGLLAAYGGLPYCAREGCDKTDLTVDHILPRALGGTHELSNLQFLCGYHNSSKGIRADDYWGRTFYWDQIPDLDKMRTAQRRAYESLTRDPDISGWFSQQASHIAGRLYLDGMVVAAGKTLVIPARAFAYNQLQREHWFPARRADRILILTKEQAIRDQLVNDIEADLVRFGIVPTAPRITAITKYEHLSDRRWTDSFDALVACVQMFWDKNGEPKADVVDVFDRFPMIFIDEPHFGAGQVRKILNCASRSVVFGTTGSPIKGNAELLRDYVLVTSYSYDDSDENDNGVKYLADDDTCVKMVRLNDADAMIGSQDVMIADISDQNYDGDQLAAAQNVVSRVIRLMEQCDAVLPGTKYAQHRDEHFVTDLLYPAHAIISCPNRAIADMLNKQVQDHFDQNRRRYPKSNGWDSNAIFTGDEDIPGEKFDPVNHPWIRAWRNGISDSMQYRCDDRSARILFVVGMAREGVSNPLCNITATISDVKSSVEVVQRLIGRALRSVKEVDNDGLIHIPPAMLDTVHIAVHEYHSTARETISAGIKFVLQMDDHLGGLPTIGDLVTGNCPVVPVDPDTDDSLTIHDRVDIAAQAWSVDPCWRSDDATTERIIKMMVDRFAPDNESKERRITDWVRGPLRDDPQRAWRMVGHIDKSDIPTVPVLLDERERHNLSDSELIEWIRWRHPDMIDQAGEVGALPFIRVMHKEWADDRVLPAARSDMDLETIRQGFARDVKAFLRPWRSPGRGSEREFAAATHAFVGKAVKLVLGAEDAKVGKGTRWDCPQVHVVLHRPDVKRAILGYARSRLIKDGWCPDLSAAFGVDDG